MAENTKNRLTGMLLSKSRRAQYLRVFAVLAGCVAIAVAVVLHQSGIAMTHEEQILTCPVTDVVAHTHDVDCYDADGNLVCTLPERELHTHTDDCYTEVRELTCGMEESDEHVHTDECYTVTQELTCGQEEITEEHVHGPGCFTTITVNDAEGDASDGESTDEVAMPAQEFDDEILDDDGNLWVHVTVKAPEGAFPANTTMKIEPLDPESVRTKVEDALKKEDALIAGAKQLKAVDITFFDEQGNEIEPKVEVEVKITSDTVRDIQNPVLVHVNKDEEKDAEVIKKVDVVNQDEKDETEGTEDTLKFESSTFSPYVIVEPKTISANVITASGETYKVTVSFGEDAGIPEDAILSVIEITEGDDGYDEYAEQTAEALDTDVEVFDHLRMFDITFLDVDGNVIEPSAAVNVEIEYVGDAIEEADEVKVVHFADEGTEIIDPTTEGEGDTTDTLTFTTESFSVYAVTAWRVSTSNINTNKNYAIVRATSDSSGYAMQALADNNQLKSVLTNITTNDNKKTINTNDDMTRWSFIKKDNAYNIKCGTNYLNIDDDGNLKLSTTPQDLKVVDNSDGTISIYRQYSKSTGGRRPQTTTGYYTVAINNNNRFKTSDTSSGYDTSDKCKLTLCEVEYTQTGQSDTNNIPTVQTVDSEADNITIRLFDYYGTGTGGDPSSVLDNVTDAQAFDHVKQGLPEALLGNDGYPVFEQGGVKHSGAEIFGTNLPLAETATEQQPIVYVGEANHLFLKSEHDSSGYYYYNSKENFAYYMRDTGNFRVYDAYGSWTSSNTQYNIDGEYYPLYDLNPKDKNTSLDKDKYGLKDSSGNAVGQAKACYFGMTVDFSFLMPTGGKVANPTTGQDVPMVYEFTGDDDVWIFIDDVLVLDIGGRHQVSKGTIDFSTGVVRVTKGDSLVDETNLLAIYRKAGKFPNGDDWVENNTEIQKHFRVTEWNNNRTPKAGTFKDWAQPHGFKMYYLEHYATASNLELKFNLTTIPTGSAIIEKALDSNTQQEYANQTFNFKLLQKQDNGDYTELQTFTLKPGERKTFEDIDLTKQYMVQEILDENQRSNYTVLVTGANSAVDPDSNGVVEWGPSSSNTKIYVKYENIPTDNNCNDLLINKVVSTNTNSTNDKFKFKIQLENTAGSLVNYANDSYYIKQGDKYWKNGSNGVELVDSKANATVYKTDQNGVTEAIPGGCTIVVEGLLSGTDFKVEEIGVVEEGSTDVEELIDKGWLSEKSLADGTYDEAELAEADGRIKLGANATVTVTNTKNIVKTKVYLKKVKKINNEETLLDGAKFTLQDPATGANLLGNNVLIEPGNDEANNPKYIGELEQGDYCLVEETAPTGYNILVKKVEFNVGEDGVVNLKNGPYDNARVEPCADGYVITVINTPGSDLPNTGGIGTTVIYATGAMIVAVAAFGLVSKKMRNNL